MKISPVATATPTMNPNEGMSASPTRIERAKSIMEGRQPDPHAVDPQVSKLQNRRSIKMSTNANPTVIPAMEQDAAPPPTDTSVPSEQVESPEEIKPLSPQFAALAKEKRALQIARAELDKSKAEFEANAKDKTSSAELISRIKSDPLGVFQEHGVTYDQLTEALLAGDNPDARIQALEAKLEALEKGTPEQANKAIEAREAEAERQTLLHISNEMEKIITTGDEFEMVRSEKAQEKVLQKIYDGYKANGIVMDTVEALNLVEDELIEAALKQAQYKKVQQKLGFGPPQMRAAGAKTMKTLTNRDGATAPMSPKERAIAAFTGKLTR